MTQREIKFRAWDKYRNKMFYNGFTLTVQNFLYEWRTIAEPQKDSLVLMQYTGLRDKNRKEIYEGDVGQWVNEHNHVLQERGYVAWYRGGLWFCKDIEGKDAIGVAHEGWEIIGNIYENPNLLK